MYRVRRSHIQCELWIVCLVPFHLKKERRRRRKSPIFFPSYLPFPSNIGFDLHCCRKHWSDDEDGMKIAALHHPSSAKSRNILCVELSKQQKKRRGYLKFKTCLLSISHEECARWSGCNPFNAIPYHKFRIRVVNDFLHLHFYHTFSTQDTSSSGIIACVSLLRARCCLNIL